MLQLSALSASTAACRSGRRALSCMRRLHDFKSDGATRSRSAVVAAANMLLHSTALDADEQLQQVPCMLHSTAAALPSPAQAPPHTMTPLLRSPKLCRAASDSTHNVWARRVWHDNCCRSFSKLKMMRNIVEELRELGPDDSGPEGACGERDRRLGRPEKRCALPRHPIPFH